MDTSLFLAAFCYCQHNGQKSLFDLKRWVAVGCSTRSRGDRFGFGTGELGGQRRPLAPPAPSWMRSAGTAEHGHRAARGDFSPWFLFLWFVTGTQKVSFFRISRKRQHHKEIPSAGRGGRCVWLCRSSPATPDVPQLISPAGLERGLRGDVPTENDIAWGVPAASALAVLHEMSCERFASIRKQAELLLPCALDLQVGFTAY